MPDLQDVIYKGLTFLKGQLKWKYHGTEHVFTAPNGARLHCYYVENIKDALNYKGHEWTWLGIDEVGDWEDPDAIDFLWACLRSVEGVPCVRRMTANPGGPGHVWVKKRYVEHGDRVVHKWQPQPKEAPHIWITSVFIQSLLENNIALMEGDPTYEARLAASGGDVLFRAQRYADWNIIAGQFFRNWNPEQHTIRLIDAGLQPWQPRWISMDWGFSAKQSCAVHWHALDEKKRVLTYKELVVDHREPIEIGKLIAQNCSEDEKITRFYLGADAFAKKTSVRTIAEEISTVLREAGLPAPVRADTDRIGGWQLMYQMLESGHWRITKNCSVLIDTLPHLQRDDKKQDDIAECAIDHCADSVRYGLKTHLGRSEVPIDKLVADAMTAVDDQGNPEPTIRMIQASAARAKFKKSRSGPILKGWRRHKTGFTRSG